jgi:hypothetical protein
MKGQPMDWNKILNWKLLSGSHQFPGPDGGTCINEAAIVAAGFEYKSVSDVADCPPCFSHVLSAYAITLNDCLSDDRRQELLMPFVTRLAGTADTPGIERERFDFIMLGLIRTVLPISLRGWKDDLAAECEHVENYDQAVDVVNKIALNRAVDPARDLIHILASARILALPIPLAIDFASILVLDLASTLVLDLASTLARAFAVALDKAAVALLDGAMKIGKQAEPVEQGIVIGRLAKIRQLEMSE